MSIFFNLGASLLLSQINRSKKLGDGAKFIANLLISDAAQVGSILTDNDKADDEQVRMWLATRLPQMPLQIAEGAIKFTDVVPPDKADKVRAAAAALSAAIAEIQG